MAVNDYSFMQTIQKRAYIYANAQFGGTDGYPLIFYTMNACKDVCIEYTHKFNKDKHGQVTNCPVNGNCDVVCDASGSCFDATIT